MLLKKLSPLLLAVLITGCTEHKDPLEGKRESFLMLNEAITPDKQIANLNVILPPASNNKDWSQSGGNVTHNMGVLKTNNPVKTAWQNSIGKAAHEAQKIINGPVIANGVVYASDVHGLISAINLKSGVVLWTLDTVMEEEDAEDAMGCGLGVAGDILYVTSSFGRVFAVNCKDGKILWQKKLSAPIYSAPTIQDNRLFVITITNELHALSTKDGADIWSYSGIIEPSALLGASNPAVADNVVIAAFSSGEIFALQIENGSIHWSRNISPATRTDTVSSIPHIKARPVIDGEVAYLISHGGKTSAVNLKTGEDLWQKHIGGVRTPAVAGDFLFLITTDEELVCLLKKTGQVRWAMKLPKSEDDKECCIWAGPVLVNEQLVLSGNNGELLFVNAKDGTVQNKIKFSEGLCTLSPVVADGNIVLLTEMADLTALR